MGSDIGMLGLLLDYAIQICGTVALIAIMAVGGWLVYKRKG